jgi:hypothetical protein
MDSCAEHVTQNAPLSHPKIFDAIAGVVPYDNKVPNVETEYECWGNTPGRCVKGRVRIEARVEIERKRKK